jgi:signal transduction histidine kinase
VLMGGLSALVGIVLTGQVVRPIRRLVTDIAEKSSTIDARAGAPVSFSAADYPSNEIGQLVRALDQFALRLHRFMQRESHFAADVSHELRTPIAVIRGAAEVLVENREFTEPVRERLRTIHRQAVRMGGLLEAMLLLARENEPGGDPACALAEVVEEALADCTARAAPGSVAVALEIRERPIVPAEHSLAYVVISNLLRNAFAHTREGSITVRLTADRIEIIDTGIGIPEHRFPEIFERLVKGEESDGSGLGLSIVARITEMLGWQIGIESRSGAGTQVNVRFAAAPAAAAG